MDPGPTMEEEPPDQVKLGVDRVLRSGSAWPDTLALDHGPGCGASSSIRSIGLVTSNGALPGPAWPSSTRRALLDAGLPITRLFTPEHGLTAAAPDGSPYPDTTDPETGLPVVSLYGPRFGAGPQELDGLDLLLFDLQDVGARFYTFLWTFSHLLEACAKAGLPLRVLDRPNPLGGLRESVEGPIQGPETPPSLLGRWPVPLRHSLTLGEMALLLRAEMGLQVDLGVVRMEGWRREMLWPATHLPFHPPSPGIPAYPSVLLYPGLALLEATNLKVGRGTPLSFQWCGAPWLDGGSLAGYLNEARLPGLLAFPRRLDPATSAPEATGCPAEGEGELCPGVFLEVTDPGTHRPVAMGLRLLSLLPTLWPGRFSWAGYPTAANPTGRGHLLRLLGSRPLVELLERNPGGLTEDLILEATSPGDWWDRAAPHLLYS